MDEKYTPIIMTGANGNSFSAEYFHIPNEGNSTIIPMASPEELSAFVSVGSIYAAIEEMTDTDIEMNETFADFECLRGNAAYEKRAAKYLDIRENVDNILRECEEERKRAEASGEQYTEHWLEKIQCHRAIKRYQRFTAEEIDAYIHSQEET